MYLKNNSGLLEVCYSEEFKEETSIEISSKEMKRVRDFLIDSFGNWSLNGDLSFNYVNVGEDKNVNIDSYPRTGLLYFNSRQESSLTNILSKLNLPNPYID